jgi:hypothetical protein
MTKATKVSAKKSAAKLSPDEIAAEEETLKAMGLKVGMTVQNTKQRGRKGKVVEIAMEEGKKRGGGRRAAGVGRWGVCAGGGDGERRGGETKTHTRTQPRHSAPSPPAPRQPAPPRQVAHGRLRPDEGRQERAVPQPAEPGQHGHCGGLREF